MNQTRQDAMGRRYDALIPGEMRRTAGKRGKANGWALVADVDGEEIRRLRPIADVFHGEVGLLHHVGRIPFAISRIDAGANVYTFVLPLVGSEVLAMLQVVHVAGFRVAFSCGTQEVLRYAFPVAPHARSELLASHLRRYSEDSVLAAASDVALHVLSAFEVARSGGQHFVCVVPTPGLRAWAIRHHGKG